MSHPSLDSDFSYMHIHESSSGQPRGAGHTSQSIRSTTTSGSHRNPRGYTDDGFPPPPPPPSMQHYQDDFPPPPPPEMSRAHFYDRDQGHMPNPPATTRGYQGPAYSPSKSDRSYPGSDYSHTSKQPFDSQTYTTNISYADVSNLPTHGSVASSKPAYELNLGDNPNTVYAQVKHTAVSPSARDQPKQNVGKEAEVDALTNMLLQNLESSADPDFFGMCSKCGRKVLGESNGCTAMEQVYHIACFTCVSCAKMLRGQSFYCMETKPYCEDCYLNTLEKCSICSKPVTDRLLRATGKPYHPECFVCVICGISLDGIPFTVDATNQIHCIEDFHKKFAPRCCICHHPIMPEDGQDETVRVVALDRSFHVGCYRCEDCNILLSSEAEGRGCYPLDDHILCKTCNAKRIQAMTTKMATEL